MITARQRTVSYHSRSAIVIDNFLPDALYDDLRKFALGTDYRHINTEGKTSRAWHIHDGFPLRSLMSAFFYADRAMRPNVAFAYPTKTGFDVFFEEMNAYLPHVPIVGAAGKDWQAYSANAWIYPPGTSLSVHNDGAGVYSGAYVYFLNPTWRLHWGGLLLMMEDEANARIRTVQQDADALDFYNQQWLHSNGLDDMLMEEGYARCIFPKRNRLVFMASDAYHAVTRVTPSAGDNLRMSIAGFFHRQPPSQQSR